MGKVKNISPSNAYAMTKKGALLVDVREPREVLPENHLTFLISWRFLSADLNN